MATIENFISEIVKNNLKKMTQTDGLHYLSFGIMSSMVEFFGACFDREDFFKSGLSRERFRKAINELDAFSEYRKYNEKDCPHDLYKNLRCGMAHIGRPGKGISFTHIHDDVNGNEHLTIKDLDDNTRRLILVCERLFQDLEKASDELLGKMKNGKLPRTHSETFMNPNLKIIDLQSQTTYTASASA
ncbi:hypothetical protein F6A13_12005 [Acidithiobacillus sp. 'AMD consortium']|uniref:hypothetical protein n=1 Tax=Acidithiobacillus sp. 'AMD consortium' TaxID=2614801 RepID=UPI00124E5C68|nr:hypothetical protein [Acidithiobacillus sp. 'AMD consortium']QFG79257.1 hypothetical protein F6A13_12005 [Acidithiobacillus sp. 'AMD consortium']